MTFEEWWKATYQDEATYRSISTKAVAKRAWEASQEAKKKLVLRKEKIDNDFTAQGKFDIP